MQRNTSSTARLEARISKELHTALKRAARLQNRTMTDFVIEAVQTATNKAIEQSEILRLSIEDQERFVQAFLNPPKPSPALKRAISRHSKLIGDK